MFAALEGQPNFADLVVDQGALARHVMLTFPIDSLGGQSS